MARATSLPPPEACVRLPVPARASKPAYVEHAVQKGTPDQGGTHHGRGGSPRTRAWFERDAAGHGQTHCVSSSGSWTETGHAEQSRPNAIAITLSWRGNTGDRDQREALSHLLRKTRRT